MAYFLRKTTGIALLALLLPSLALAQFGQFGNLEQPLPGVQETNIDRLVNRTNPFLFYISLMFNFITALIVALAIIMVVIGGYTYMTAGGDGKKVESAKKIITAALLAIALALTAFLLLNVLGPQFTPSRDPLSPNANSDIGGYQAAPPPAFVPPNFGK